MSRYTILKPIMSEKSNKLSETQNTYIFKVDKTANKLLVKKEVENLYGVVVEDVKTLILPAKSKSRHTKKGLIVGRNASYKKAYVTLKKGESIDFYAL